MKTNDMIKYAAIALAAWMLYKWITSQTQTADNQQKQIAGGTGAGAGTVAGSGAGAGAGTSPTAGTGAGTGDGKPTTQNPPNPPVPTPPTADIYAAALSASDASKTGSWTTSGHAWNWYRMVAAQAAGWSEEEVQRRAQADLGPEMNNNMTAAQYHELLAANGLSGLGKAQVWGGGYRQFSNYTN
jgi:hypothetical protein